MEEQKNKYGLSRKTNIVIAGVGSIVMAKDSKYAIGAILIAVLVGVTYQFIIDFKKGVKDEGFISQTGQMD